nr:hemagglutinin repeat-containing protein [Leptotrichia trevisanii]
MKGSKDTKVRISAGGQTYEYKTKEVTSKGKTYRGIAVDGKSAGSMYAGKIDIISNDKGAGVNTKGDLVSIDDVTITANGEITTEKAHSTKRVVYKTPKKVRIRKQVTAGEKVVVKAKKTEIDVDVQVITGYLKKSLGEEAFEAESDEVNIYGKIEANGKVVINGKSTRNAGQISATDKVTVNGERLDNSKGEIRSDGKIELNTQSTVNRQGYILSDGLTKEDVARSTENLESSQNAERLGNTSEAGVSISGDLDNTKGMIKGRKVSIGGNLDGNSNGLVRSMGELALNGSVVDNAGGRLEGQIRDIRAKKVINDNGVMLTGKGLSIISEDTSNRNGEIYANGDVKLVGNRIDNFSGVVKGSGNLDIAVSSLNNERGNILSGGKASIKADDFNNREGVALSAGKMEVSSKNIDNRKGNIISQDEANISSDKIDNREGNIQSDGKLEIASKDMNNKKGNILGGKETAIRSDKINNIIGNIQSAGNVMIRSKNLDNEKGNIVSGGAVRIDSDRIDNRKGNILGSGKTDVSSKDTDNREGSILSEDDVEIRSDKINNILGKVKGNGKIDVKAKTLDNKNGEITGIDDVNVESTKLNNDKGKISSINSTATVKSDDASNVRGIIESLTKTTVNVGHIRNAGGKIISEGIVELNTPSEYTYEGTVEGKVLTAINGGKITVNDRIERSGALELIAQNGITLNNDVAARILSLQTNSDFDNNHLLKGNEYLSIKANNVTNSGQMLSDKYVYVKADGRLVNGLTGRIVSNGDSFLEAQAIENNRGNILANGTLTMIADTLIRNDLGRIHSGTGTYGVVRNGRFENIGQSNVEIIENVNSSLGVSGVPSRTGRFRTRSPRVQNILNDRPTYTMNASSESSDITSDGFIALDVNGDMINRDAGNIEAKGIAQIKANNVYNISRMATSQDGNTVLVGAGGRIAGSEVYLDVAGKVVNGIEDSRGNTYRREDGVLVDNRNVVSAGQSMIAGTNQTAIKAGSVINTAQIGESGKGATFIDTQGTVANTAMGGNAAKIEGSTVVIDGKGGVTNTGSVIEGTKGTQVVSSNGQVINESTVQSETVYRNVTERKGLLRLLTETAPQIDRVTESIRNVGKIESSNGLVYVEGDRGVINVAANLRGAEGTYLVGKNGTIEDRTISLKDLRHNAVETKTETREVHKAGLGRRSRGAARTEEVQVQTRWDIVDRTDTVSGIIGMGKNTVLEGKDIVLASSDLRGTEDIVLNAKNYILMLSTVNSEHKHRTQTHTKRRWHGGKKTTTENWTEDNEYANNVDITTDGNILLNYHGAGAPADNRGIFAQGVNFNAKGQVLGFSEGNIYLQGTKDRLNSVYTSKTKKSFAGIGYGKSSDYVNTYQERYRLGQLYGDAGITYDADGKLRVEGVDIQSSGKTFFRGKMGTQFLPGIENGHRYEEHKSSGLKGSLGLSWSGLSAGVGYEKSVDRIAETTKTVVPNRMNVAGEAVIETEKGSIDFYPTTGAVGKLVFNANGNEINILDMQNERTYDRQTQKSYAGIGANLGIPVVSSLQQVWEAGRGLRHARSREDYINGGSRLASAGAGTLASYGELFTNPISSGVSLNYSNSRSSQHREESVSVGSNLYVANGVEYNGSNLHTRGLNIQNDGDTVYNLTGSIIKEAGKSTIRETSSSTGYGISLARGLTDGKGVINPLKSSNITASINASGYRGRNNGVYYANNKDVTKGNSHYNVAGDVKITGVDVKTGSVSGTVGGNTTVESVQDEFNSEGRGYSTGISAGIGKGFDKNNPRGYGVNLSSVSAGHTRTDVEQRITRNVTEFTAGAGFLDVKGTVKQVGSLIDGNFTLNSGGYEHEDLKDIDKSRTVGINVTVYPNVSYSQRDRNGNQVYMDGSNPKKTGTAVKTGLTYGETDKTREILATVGAGVTMNQDLEGVNRDPDRQTTEFEGRDLKPVNVDLLAEYWATQAGQGKLRDMLENAERTTDGIRRVLTTRDSNGNLQILKSVEAESAVQKFMRIGYVDTRGKTQQQVKQELEARFGSLAKKGVKVNFYDNRDIDAKNLDETSLSKLTANGFAITEDGTVWINKSFVDSGKVIDFNKVTQHEISHIIFGKDSEFQAQYLESAYGSFLEGISENGYLHDNAGITDYDTSSLSMFDRMLLNSYILDQIQLWEPTGDDRIDRVVRVTHLMPEVQQKRNISIIGRLEKIYKPGNKERERRRKDIETRVRKKKIAENNKKKPSDKKNSKELEKEIAKEVNTKLKTSDITNIEGQDVKMLFKEIEADRKMGITQKENIMFKETVKKHPEMIDAYFRKSRKDRIDEIRMLDFYKQKTDKLGLTSKQIADFAYIANEGIYNELWSKSPGENYKTPYSDVDYKVLDRIDMVSGLQAVLIQDPNKKD